MPFSSNFKHSGKIKFYDINFPRITYYFLEEVVSLKCYDGRYDDSLYGTDNREGCKVRGDSSGKSFSDPTLRMSGSTWTPPGSASVTPISAILPR